MVYQPVYWLASPSHGQGGWHDAMAGVQPKMEDWPKEQIREKPIGEWPSLPRESLIAAKGTCWIIHGVVKTGTYSLAQASLRPTVLFLPWHPPC